MKSRNWLFLFSSNFVGILNDNFLKNSIIFWGMTWGTHSWLTLSQLTSFVAAGLVLPYLFLSPLSGRMAVKYSKQTVFRRCKIAEFPIVLLACVAFWMQWIFVAILSVFLMGIQSCLYSPSKYGLIRDIGGEKGIPFGSGMFETVAFLGILVGTVVASVMADHSDLPYICLLFLALALCGYLFTRAIHVEELPFEREQTGSLNPLKFLKHSFLFAKRIPDINIAVFGVSMFWLIGGVLQMNIIIHCKQYLLLSSTATGMVMAVAATGIASGCLISGRMIKRYRNRRVLLTGLVLMILFLSLLILLNPEPFLLALLIFLFALAGGLFEVPCLAMIQQANIGRKLGDMLAYMNFVTFLFILAGSALFWLITYFTHENSMAVFVAMLALCLLTIGIMYRMLYHPS